MSRAARSNNHAGRHILFYNSPILKNRLISGMDRLLASEKPEDSQRHRRQVGNQQDTETENEQERNDVAIELRQRLAETR